MNHAATNARIIGANEHESHYIFDLLFNNTSEIKPEVLSTDTHGVNHVNFALQEVLTEYNRLVKAIYSRASSTKRMSRSW